MLIEPRVGSLWYRFSIPIPIPIPALGGDDLDGFDHEKLDVYQVAIEFVGLANDVIERLPRGRAYLSDQLQCAATSIPLNIAEGAGEENVLEEQLFFAGRDLLVRIVAMLTKMVLNLVQEPGTGSGSGSEPD